MSGCIVWGTLAAFGAVSLLWTLLGWLLPSGRGMVLICVEHPDPGVLSRWRWLRGMGLLSCPLIAVSDSVSNTVPEDVEICGREELLTRLERENIGAYGTGTGNSAGCGQCRDLPEL